MRFTTNKDNTSGDLLVYGIKEDYSEEIIESNYYLEETSESNIGVIRFWC